MNLAAQIVTMLAVVLGSATSYVTNRLTERSKRRQDFKSRWDLRKLDTYAEFIGAVRIFIAAAVALYDASGASGKTSTARTSKDDLHTDLISAGRERALAFERLMLLAGDAVVEAAHRVQETAMAVEWLATGEVSGTLADWRAANSAAFAAINRFHEVARVDLGVTGRFRGDEHSARGLLLPPALAIEAEEAP